MLDAGHDLVVVGRAGVGLDNVDVAAATERGVMVVNAPQSNILSAAEQAMALLLAQARNIPQAHAALVAGRWERSKWEGVELHGKTLGVVGLGRVGALVAQRALAFGMGLVGLRPVRLAGAGPAHGRRAHGASRSWWRQADFVTIHLPEDARDHRPLRPDLLAKAKPGIRIINTARGGIVDEEALAEAIRDGIVSPGPASTCSPRSRLHRSPLFELPQVVVSPHLGASTEEAQDKAGVTIAEQVLLALAGRLRALTPSTWRPPTSSETVRPVHGAGRAAGPLLRCLHDGCPTVSRSSTRASWPAYDTGILTLSVLKGIFGGRHRGAGLLRQRPAAGRAAGPRGAEPPPPRRRTTT